MGPWRQIKLGRKGFSVIFVALALLAIFLFVALAVDIGYMYVVKTQLQNAADSAALAGAGRLDGTIFTNQTGARNSAKFYAERNPAGRSTSGNVNVYFATTVGANSFTDDNDIIFGFWSSTARQFYAWGDAAIPADAVVNAVKVRTRRDVTDTADPHYDRRGQVPLFFTRIFPGWASMSVNATAVGWRPAAPTTGLTICVQTCNLTPLPKTLFFKKQDYPTPATTDQGIAFTELGPTMDTNFGPNSTMAQIIDGRISAPNVCDKWIAVNNAFAQQMGKLLSDAFQAKSQATGYWDVIVPVLDVNTPGGSACPPDPEGRPETYHVSQYAKVRITGVTLNPRPSVTIADIQCVDCPANGILGLVPRLAQ